jgi:hypothetical protein
LAGRRDSEDPCCPARGRRETRQRRGRSTSTGTIAQQLGHNPSSGSLNEPDYRRGTPRRPVDQPSLTFATEQRLRPIVAAASKEKSIRDASCVERTFMQRFAENGFSPIEYDGLTVHPMFRMPIAVGDRWRLRWLDAASPRVQGLALRVRLPDVGGRRGEAGRLKVAGASSPWIHLWRDTAPPVVEVLCEEATAGAELRVSNRWRLDDGGEDEWLNNFGMLIEHDDDDGIVLRCSEGYGTEPPSFNSLVVRLEPAT